MNLKKNRMMKDPKTKKESGEIKFTQSIWI